MRKYWKVICSVLVTVMVLSVFTGIVLADDPYKYKAGDKFDIAYYEDEKLLNVKCYVESINLYQIEWPETPDITKVVFDVSNIEYEDKDFKGISLRGEVDYNQENSSFYSNVTSVEVVSTRTQILNYLEIYGFSGVGSDGITISNRLDINEMTFTNLKVDSLDFLKNYDFENVQFNNCKSLEVADMSAYPDVHFHFFSCNKLTGVIFPEGISTIEYSHFFNCKNLKSVGIPATVTTIMPMAFANTGLEHVKIPTGVTRINHETFNNCKNLQSVILPATVTSIDASAFFECESLKDVYYTGTEAQFQEIELTNDREYAETDYETVYQAFQGAEIHFNYVIPTGWVEIDGSWRLYDSNGDMLTGWQQDGGKWYYLAENGDLRIGWQNYNNKWYYLDPVSGAMKTGWIKDGGEWYYLDKNGAMVTGWLKEGKDWYYFNQSGVMLTGWRGINGKWYFFEDSGAMKTGWLNDNGTWYYLKSIGSMAAGEYCEGYWINEDGTWTYPYKFQWKQDSKGWYYIASNGWYVKNETVTIDGVEYEFDSAGYIKE